MSYAEYTGKARAALMLAEKCAKQFGQGYVGTEHILVGLLREKTGVAAVVLQDNGVNEADVVGFKNLYDLPVQKNPCPADGYTKREYAKDLIKQLNEDSPGVADRLFHAVIDGPLPAWKKLI
jgi:ATP-dependent Clp protease ATP-binding subunit ClpA